MGGGSDFVLRTTKIYHFIDVAHYGGIVYAVNSMKHIIVKIGSHFLEIINNISVITIDA